MGGKSKHNTTVSVGKRNGRPPSKATLGSTRPEHRRSPNIEYVRDGMSAQQRAVFNSVIKPADECSLDEVVLRGVNYIKAPTSSSQLGVDYASGCLFSRGMDFRTSRKVSVTNGANGWGMLLIDHRCTAWSMGSALPSGNAWATREDVDAWVTDDAWTGDFTSGVSLSTYNPAAGHVGIVPISSLGRRGYQNPSPNTTGDYGAAILGQETKLIANTGAVLDREGTIYSRSTTCPMPSTLDQEDLDDDPRTMAVDAAALTEGSMFRVTRHPNACGWANFMRGGAAPHGGTGTMQYMGLGYTLIAFHSPVVNNNHTTLVFEVNTVGVYTGFGMPASIAICYNPMAYYAVACAWAHAAITNATSDQDRSAVIRKAYRRAEGTVAAQTPSFLAELGVAMSNGGAKLARHMGSLLLNAINGL